MYSLLQANLSAKYRSAICYVHTPEQAIYLMVDNRFGAAVQQLKSPDSSPIRITNEDGETIAFLEIAKAGRADLDAWANDVSVWRNTHSHRFATQFKATPENARGYLDNVIAHDDQAFFMITNSDGDRLGHFGFKQTSENEAELDNLIRSDVPADTSLTYLVELTLLLILFTACDIQKTQVYVLKDNRPAYGLHRLCGFRKTKEVAVKRVAKGDTLQLVADEAAPLEGAENSFVYLDLSREKFLQSRALWLAARFAKDVA